MGTRDVQTFHLHSLKGAFTLRFPARLVIISSCCPDHQWALQVSVPPPYRGCKAHALCQDTAAQTGAAGKPGTLQPCALKRPSNFTHPGPTQATDQILCLDLFRAPGLPYKQHSRQEEGLQDVQARVKLLVRAEGAAQSWGLGLPGQEQTLLSVLDREK